MRPSLFAVALWFALAVPATSVAQAAPCDGGRVFEDRNGNGRRDAGERGLPGQRVSDGERIAVTDAQGRFRLPLRDNRSQFLIKPAGYRLASRASGLPDYWLNVRLQDGPALKYGGMPVATGCRDYGLIPERRTPAGALDVLVFADPQTKTATDVDYYRRDIVEPLLVGHAGARVADLGLSLGDITHDDLTLYPQLNAVTARLGVPWLHAPGNHDLDFDATRDEDSLLSFRHVYGPDSYAWEEPQANFVVLDDVVYQPGGKPDYIGGLRPDQFAFLENYLAGASKQRLLVLALHIPLFDAAPGRETFRRADRERLFALLKEFPNVLVLSGHSHTQRHVFHDAAEGWQGAKPLHEYNVGAACGAFWSGVKDAQGIPDTTMSDGTPNGYARLSVRNDAGYGLRWFPARQSDSGQAASPYLRLYLPKAVRRGSYPVRGVFANVYMGREDSRVEYRIDQGEWKPMRRIEQPDPAVLAENARDDQAERLRGYDRAAIATPSAHLWNAMLPTDAAAGEHRVEVRVFDPWQGEQRLSASYRLLDAAQD
ncbi:calcineurin-like phosphoesterase C-terminal domain-containing protein [Lysobacter sp. 1R34A]|uniref:calcineurin-like phosphoesterase C-terminal domain-containing protein n=1 Tax=Lysobacter sp. 1R34A TaxID=3445786 RepID=UPI003EF068B9